jgi:hypothetical protein
MMIPPVYYVPKINYLYLEKEMETVKEKRGNASLQHLIETDSYEWLRLKNEEVTDDEEETDILVCAIDWCISCAYRLYRATGHEGK